MQSGDFFITPLDTQLLVNMDGNLTNIPDLQTVQLTENVAGTNAYAKLNRVSVKAASIPDPPTVTATGAANPMAPVIRFLRDNLGKPVELTYQTAPEDPIYNDAAARVAIATTGVCTFSVKTPPEVPVGDATTRGLVDIGHAIIADGKAYIVSKVDGAVVTVVDSTTNKAPTQAVTAVAYKIVNPQLRHKAFHLVTLAGNQSADASGVVSEASYQFDAKSNEINWTVVV